MPHKLKAVLRRRWLLLVLVPLLATLAVWLVTPAQSGRDDESYTATQTVIRQLDETAVPGFVSTAQAALFATTGRVPTLAANRLGYEGDPEVLADSVSVEPDENTFSLEFSAVAPTPEEAERVVQAFVNSFITVIDDENARDRFTAVSQARQQEAEAQRQLTAFLTANGDQSTNPLAPAALRLEQEQLQAALTQATTRLETVIANNADPERFASLGPEGASLQSPSIEVPQGRTTRAVIALPVGLLLAGLLILALERLQPRIDTAREIESLLSYPVIARIPNERARRRKAARPSLESFAGGYAEAHRALRSSLEFVHRSRDPRPPVILITSALASEGKSSTASYLALACAEADQRTVLIDGDLRKPTLHRLFGVNREPGLVTMAHDVGLDPEDIARTPIPLLRLVPAGGTTDVTAPVREPLHRVVDWGRQAEAVVIVDTSPLLAANDAIELVPLVDHVVLVIRAGQTTVRALEDAAALLARHDAPVAGCVLVGALADPGVPYYDYYGLSGKDDLAPEVSAEPVAEPLDESLSDV